MKRILTVLLAATMVLGAVAQASAVDVKVKGMFDFAFGWRDGTNLYDGEANEDDFIARQRLRTQVEFIASEALRGVVQFEIGTLNWGGNNSDMGYGGQLDTDGINIETRYAYIDWYVPGTGNSAVENALRVKMGLQHIALPTEALGNAVFANDVAGIVASYQFTKNVALTAFWARPYDEAESISSGNTYDAMDLFGLILPLTFEEAGFNITPWAVYSNIGGASTFGQIFAPQGFNNSVDLYSVGLASKLVMGDFDLKLDAMYGITDGSDDSVLETRGWLAAMAFDYNGFTWGTPGLFGWYASGDDDQKLIDEGRLGGLPVIGGASNDGFYPTSFGFPGSYSIGDDTLVNGTGVGTWGIGVQIANLSFVKDLSHTIRFAYYQGTNHEEMVPLMYGLDLEGMEPFQENIYMSTADSAYEVNLDSTYNIYDNLQMVVELGYIHLDLDSRGKTYDGLSTPNVANDDVWKAQVLFRYSF